MGKLIYLGIFLASLDPRYQDASDNARRAILETKMMKIEMKQLEDDADYKLFDITGLHKEDLAYAAYAYPIFAGKVSSKSFTNFKYVTNNLWIIRPELEYSFHSQESTANLIIIKEW